MDTENVLESPDRKVLFSSIYDTRHLGTVRQAPVKTVMIGLEHLIAV